VKSRGNTSLPTDMVKVLKSQDGNYIRVVRQSGLKVIGLLCVSSLTDIKLFPCRKLISSRLSLVPWQI
jgi:hypothetical protein